MPEQEARPAELDRAFAEFFALHKQGFLRVAAARLRNLHDADEALMDAAIQMHRKWPRIEAHNKPIALAYTILNAKITDFYRRRARYAGHEVPVGTDSTAYPDTVSVDEIVMLRGYEPLDRALAELQEQAPKQAECVRLYHLSDMDYDEIATFLNITKGQQRPTHTWAGSDCTISWISPNRGKGFLMLEETLRAEAQVLHDMLGTHDTDDFMRRLAVRIAREAARPPRVQTPTGATPAGQADSDAEPEPAAVPTPPSFSAQPHPSTRPRPYRRRRRRPTPIVMTDPAAHPAAVLTHVRSLCETVLCSNDIDTLLAFDTYFDRAGARTFACLLYTIDHHESALYWWGSRPAREIRWPPTSSPPTTQPSVLRPTPGYGGHSPDSSDTAVVTCLSRSAGAVTSTRTSRSAYRWNPNCGRSSLTTSCPKRSSGTESTARAGTSAGRRRDSGPPALTTRIRASVPRDQPPRQGPSCPAPSTSRSVP
ncbi:sigma-70 family RNA polymerase sigma factor [Streptomyces sp. M10(2022)]